MVHNEGSFDETMYEHFTDGENTGAPLVPQLGHQETEQTNYEEEVLSHRIEP